MHFFSSLFTSHMSHYSNIFSARHYFYKNLKLLTESPAARCVPPKPVIRQPDLLSFFLRSYFIKRNAHHLPPVVLYIIPHIHPRLCHMTGLYNLFRSAGTALQPQRHALKIVRLQFAAQRRCFFLFLLAHRPGDAPVIYLSPLLSLSA